MERKIVNCPHCGKILSKDFLKEIPRKKVKCPVCGSQKNWKSGTYKTPNGKVQRYMCKDCGSRFIEH